MIDVLHWAALPALATLFVLVAMLVLFVRETYPPEVVAIAGLAALVATGILPVSDMVGVLSNPAPVTIACMLILSGALIRTGALDAITQAILARIEERPGRTLGGFTAMTVTASAFMNNTPVVVMLIPVALRIARKIGISASQILIPLSYATILGGMCTLIGTSTNLLVDGVARQAGLAPFSLFEITPAGVAIAIVGAAFMVWAAPRYLPKREALVDFLSQRKAPKFFTEVVIPEGSKLSGRRLGEVEHFRRDGMTVIDVIRGDLSLRRNLGAVELTGGDRVVLRTGVDELMGLRGNRALAVSGEIDPVGRTQTVTVEALIAPDCKLVGRTIGDVRFRRRYGVYPLAVHRRTDRVGSILDEVRIRVGDTLLLEGAPEDIRRLSADQNLADITQPQARPYRRERAPIVIGILALVVVLGAFGVLPIAGLGVIAVALVLLTRCIDADEAFQMIDIRLLSLILAMLGVGRALEVTGAVGMVVGGAAPALEMLPGWLDLWLVIVMASVLTEILSNNAVAVVVTPVAIGLAHRLGLDPRPFVVGVMIAASASFATPIGYQTNTLVYAPGGYRFTDYMRLGVPLNIIVSIVATLVIPVVWPL